LWDQSNDVKGCAHNVAMVYRDSAYCVKSRVVLCAVDELTHVIHEDDVGTAIPKNRDQLRVNPELLIPYGGSAVKSGRIDLGTDSPDQPRSPLHDMVS
jgi:hypothetical protein